MDISYKQREDGKWIMTYLHEDGESGSDWMVPEEKTNEDMVTLKKMGGWHEDHEVAGCSYIVFMNEAAAIKFVDGYLVPKRVLENIMDVSK